MNEIKSFTIYREIFKLIDTIKPIKKRNDFLGKIIDFYYKDIEPEFKKNSNEEAIWENIEKPIRKYKIKALNGSKGGRPKDETSKKTETKNKTKIETETETEKESTSNDVFVNVNVINKNNKNNSKFIKPSIEEIKEYCSKRNNSINANAFYDFYESKGWKVGNQSMKNWKACVRTWEQREENKPKKKTISEIFEEVKKKNGYR